MLWLVIALSVASIHAKSVQVEQGIIVEKRNTVCYGEFECFSSDPPFRSAQRPVSVVPESPDKVQTKYRLFTPELKNSYVLLDARHPESAASVWKNFKDRPTKIIVHGFIDNPDLTDWMTEMKNELLKHGSYNVIIVDWSHGNQIPYTQASANTRIVGAQVAELIKSLIKTEGVSASDFHIIGHSLGAHLAGYIGERVIGLGRITGLDPAGPYFENTDEVVRLDNTDAVFVDIIHTDAKNLLQLGMGTKQQSGHVDFYPNLGHDQPGCTRDPLVNIFQNGLIGGVTETVACNHFRSIKYFTESINSQCPFTGFECASEEVYNNHLCRSCANGKCARMGFYADQNKPAEGFTPKYYLRTGQHAPFCQYHIDVTVSFSHKQDTDWSGTFSAVVKGDNGTVTISDSTKFTFTSGYTLTVSGMLPNDFGAVRSVSVSWHHVSSILDPLHWNIFGLRHPTLYLDQVEVYKEEASTNTRFCAPGQTLENDKTVTLTSKC